jgi:PKD repeat protein
MLIYQAQGAQINTGNNSSFGMMSNLNGAGYYELIVLETNSGNGWYQTKSPMAATAAISAPALGLQAVTLPNITQDATVTGAIAAKPYSSATGLGGIIALDVPGKLTMLAPISADGAGFQGGAGTATQGNSCSWVINNDNWFYPTGSWRGAQKGEGIAQIVAGAECGRGPQNNGGGGGNDHNSGGGGGGHALRGGRGGQNNEPDNLGCDGTNEGEGGYGTTLTTRIFMGGGGGAGHANNGAHPSGGAGGGIVLIRAKVLDNLNTNAEITARGTNGAKGLGDGGGGGGAGGTIICIIEDQSKTNPATFSTPGGNGGDSESAGNRCFGPGGGGAGGRFLSNLGSGLQQSGGLAGVVTLSSNGCNGSNNGALGGGLGTLEALLTLPQNTNLIAAPALVAPTQPIKICTGQTLNVTLATTHTSQIKLEKRANGAWIPITANDTIEISNSGILTLGAFTAAKNDTIRVIAQAVNACFTDAVSGPIIIQVSTGPDLAFTPIINGLQVSFQNNSTGYTSLLWDFGNGVLSNIPQPSHTYQNPGQYTVFLTLYSPCDTITSTQVINLSLAPSANFTHVDSLLGCNSLTLQLQPLTLSPTASYQWITPGASQNGSNQTNYTATYTQSGTFPITLIAKNTAGQADTMLSSLVVQIQSAPNAQFTYSVQGTTGVVTFQNQSTNGTAYLWNFGNNTQLVSSDTSITRIYYAPGTYVVTLVASNPCGASVVQTNVILGIVNNHEVTEANGWLLYPNPAENSILLVSQEPTSYRTLKVTDVMGQTVLTSTIQGLSAELSLEQLAAGMYFLQLEGGLLFKFLKL